LLLVFFVTLAWTGFALKYPEGWWARPASARAVDWGTTCGQCHPGAGTRFAIVSQAGRRPHLHFRGLLKLYTRYGLQGFSPTFRGLYREAPP